MDLSIIIPSFNTKMLLERCLTSVYQSLKGSEIAFEIMVVDNASQDGTVSLVRKKFPQVHLVCNKTNVGFSKANNQAIRKAGGNHILLLNSDIVVQDDAIGILYRFIKRNPSVFVGGKLLNEDGSPQPSCGPFFTLPVVAAMLFARGDHWGVTRYSPDGTKSVDWISGACIMAQKSSFMDAGFFDERIFMYMEEIDLLYRGHEKGHDVYFLDSARFIHTGAASSGDRRRPVVNIYRGLVYFYEKHYSTSALTVLRIMLRIKALAAILVGRMIGKPSIVQTYEEALRVL